MIRTKIKTALGWNSDGYEKIKIVCDELGWHKDMQSNRIADAQRHALLEQANHMCSRCGATDDLTIDHIKPQVKGGNNEPDNLQVLCRSCNSQKGIATAWK